MRKLPFVLLLVIALCVPVIIRAAYGSAFGYRFGLGTSGISGDDAPLNAGSAFAAAPVGLFLELSLGPQISLMPEISWYKYSVNSDPDTSYDDESFNYYYDYLQIPVIMKFKLSKGDLQPCIFGGGYYASTLGADYSRGGSLTHHDIADETSGSNYGFILGLGMDVVPDLGGVKGFHFSLDLRRTMGMSSIYSDERSAKVSSTLFMIGLGWAFGVD